MTGVWKRSAMSNDFQPNSKHSCTVPGINISICVSPWLMELTMVRSPCEVRVGMPVLGPTRCTSHITMGTSA